MTIARAIIGLFIKIVKGSDSSDRDLKNLYEFIFLFSERCNYAATL